MRYFRAIVIDPNSNARAMLKTAAQAVTELGDVSTGGSLKEALTLISKRNWDLIFISSKLQLNEVKEFIHAAKQLPNCAGTAFVSVVKGQGVTEASLAGMLASGFNGFIYEPFSTDRLRECVQLSASLKAETTKAHLKKVLTLVVHGLVRCQQSGSETSDARTIKNDHDALLEICRDLRELTSYCGVSYENFINQFFEDMAAEDTQSYAGASRRLNARVHAIQEARERLKIEVLSSK